MHAALMAWKVLEEQQPELAAFGAEQLFMFMEPTSPKGREAPLKQSGVGYAAWGQVRVRGDLQIDLGYAAQRGDAGINAMFYRARYD